MPAVHGRDESPQIGVPLPLDALDRADVPLEALECPAVPNDLEVAVAVLAVLGGQQEMAQAPPVDVVEVEVPVQVRPALAGHDGAEGDDLARGDVRLHVVAERHVRQPPDGVGVGVDCAGDERPPRYDARREIAGEPLVHPLRDPEVRDFLVQLVDGLVAHPVVAVCFTGRVVGVAERLAVERLGPAAHAGATAELVAVLEQLELEFGMVVGQVEGIAEEASVGLILGLDHTGDLLGLLGRGGRLYDVVAVRELDARRPAAAGGLPDQDADQNGAEDQKAPAPPGDEPFLHRAAPEASCSAGAPPAA